MAPSAEQNSFTPGLVLSGGGARAAYQAGVLRYIGQTFSDAHFPVLSGVSAGSINTAHWANHTGSAKAVSERLVTCWRDICNGRIFRSKSLLELARELWHRDPHERQALLDTGPLRAYLHEHLRTEAGALVGVEENVQSGRLKALALSTSNYMTGQTVTWVQGCEIQDWARPNRVGIQSTLTVDHVMASAALPLLFPAVPVGDAWYGDGGLRLFDPLAPAIHLGADALLAISTRYQRSRAEADQPAGHHYPSMVRMIGVLMNALFLDVLEHDAAILQRINRLLRRIPEEHREDLRLKPIRLLVLRPSRDLGTLADGHDPPLQGALGWMLRTFGGDVTERPDWLSMLSFTPAYIERLLEIGYEDARRQHDRIARFFDPAGTREASETDGVVEL